LRFDNAGGVIPFIPPAIAALPSTKWRMARSTRAETATTIRQTLEDTPFYARSVLSTQLLGTPVTAMHESLSLRRFSSSIVQAMLPFRMPRRGAWRST
jgi:carotenoid 1,2-hydratase